MKVFIAVSCLVLGLQAHAGQLGGVRSKDVCDENCKHQQSLSEVMSLVQEHMKSGPQDGSCPAAGQQMINSRAQASGSMLSAKSILASIQTTLKREAQQISQDTSKCGACEQVNVVSPVVSSRPKDIRQDPKCESYPAQNLRADFASESEAANFVELALRGRSNEGRRLYAGCPDPCSFYIYNAQSTAAGGKITLNLHVRCGNPRAGMMSAYQFAGSHIQEWTCRKPGVAKN